MQKANREHWKQERDKMISRASAQVQQKAANAISDNALIAQRLKNKLLRKLEKEIDNLPDKMGSETSGSKVEYGKNEKGRKIRIVSTQSWKLRELTAAYRDLVGDMDLNSSEEKVSIIIDV